MTDLFGQEIVENRRGGGESMFHVIGASNHCAESRAEDDFYATPPEAVEMLCDLESFSTSILEPCCGQGHIAKVLCRRGYDVTARDLVDRGYGEEHGVDFLKDVRKFDGDIITNPPYNMAQQFVEHALKMVSDGHKVAMFLKLTFAEGKARRAMYERTPPYEYGFLRPDSVAERMGQSGTQALLLIVGGYSRRVTKVTPR